MGKYILVLLMVGGLLAVNRSLAATSKFTSDTSVTDTQSLDDIVFTEIGADDSVKVDSAAGDTAISVNAVAATDSVSDPDNSIWGIFIAGLVGGFLAILMPCIYPMIPMTVSFFTKRAETKKKGIQGAVLYGLSIIVIYVLLGLIITLLFGAGALNELSTNGIFNVFIFAVLLAFGISFLGAFEIVLPSSLTNKLDAKSDSKGLVGIFFMAATLAVVSFSCTGPIIGTLLVTLNDAGGYLAPIVGMFGFSLALALVFSVFAVFPNWMTSLPKSGGWLNSVKVVLGFVEIALSLKFLSSADLAYHWGILDREVFVSIWIVIAAFTGLYLLGKLKFSHDSDVPFISITRLFLAGGFLAFALYMVPGLWGAPLKIISGLTPPLSTQDFKFSVGSAQAVDPESINALPNGAKKKYSDFLDVPNEIDGFMDYEEALSYAKRVHKPLFLDFTGHACVNCREMEANVWTEPEIDKMLRNKYVVVSLYTDDKKSIPENEQFYSDVLKKKVTTVGLKFMHLQAKSYNTISQPWYVLLSPDEKLLVSPPIGAEFNKDKFKAYLQKGLAVFADQN
ncbi:thiol:disulfide interchange protein DsbD [bacterium A37T11]|nr:thiol:disulfide interchange protein DsbD [bacterium A37T11]